MRHAWLLGTGATAALLAALLTAAGRANGTPVEGSSVAWLLGFAVTALVGALILDVAPGNRVGAAFVAAGLATPLAALLEEVSIAWDSAGLHVVSLMLFGAAYAVATTLPLLYFPDNRLPSPRWRWAVVVVAASVVVVWVGVLVSARPVDDGDVVSPWAVEAFGAVPLAVANGGVLAASVVTLAAAYSIVLRWRRGDELTRTRLSWLALAALVVMVLTLAAWLLPGVPDAVGALAETVQVVVVPISTYVAIARCRLFDVDLVLRRSLVYAVGAGLVAGVYVVTMLVSSRIAGEAAGYGASLVAAAAVAAVLLPVRDRLDRRLGRWLYGHRDPARVLAEVQAAADTGSRPADVLTVAVGAIQEALKVDQARIDPPGGTPDETGTAVPLVALGRTEGVLVVGSRADGAELSRRDRALLDAIAPQVALLARAVRLGRDVQSSRERLVTAQEAERLRLRRDLHDGVGPILAGLTLQVDALGAMVRDEEAVALATRIKGEMRGAIEALRETVDGLRPADLDQLGLAESLTQRAELLSLGGVRTELVCPQRLTLGAATEVAAYRIATEAMTNVLRHAGATRCTVRVALADDELVLVVEDDGCGVAGADQASGVGLGSIRDRAEELGGEWRIGPRDGGGTLLEVRLPAGGAS